jgi:hypothetical protein
MIDNLPKDTAEIETGKAEKSSPGTRQTERQVFGLVLRNRKKFSQIINAYLYLSFFLLIILCVDVIWRMPTSLPTFVVFLLYVCL